MLFLLGGLVLLEVCAQLLLPYDRAVPLARVGPVRAGFSSRSDLARIFQEQFEASKVEVKSGDRAAVYSLPKLGAAINNDQMAEKLTAYSFGQRCIPFSVFWTQPHVKSFELTMTGAQVSKVIDEIAQQLTYAPTNASLELIDSKLVVGVAKPGNTVTAAQVRSALSNATYSNGTTMIQLAGKAVVPETSDADIVEAKQQAAAALEREVSIAIVGKDTITPDATTRAQWLAIDTTSHPAKLTINQPMIEAYVTKLNDKVKTAATPSQVVLVDGNEQKRTPGQPGASLDVAMVSQQLAMAMLGQDAPKVVATLQPIASPAQYTRSYTNSQEGLQAYVAYATSTQNVRIVVQQLDGAGWSASGRADESIPSASTYKLYVMLRVFDDINNGKLNWDTPMLDTTAGGCFERTIVPSTNPCAEEWIRQYGRTQLTEYIRSKGFSAGTGFTFSDATHTTAGDLAKYLIGLENGTLVSGSNRDMLLEKMSRQLYRYGIPTGTKGWAQDKVGFLWDYIHDAAIVHNPKGTYVLVIMTKGYSYGYIANVAKQIDSILYP